MSDKTASWHIGPVTAAYTEELENLRCAEAVSLQVKYRTAAPTAADIKLQSSINGEDWTDLIAVDESETTGVVNSRATFEATAGLPALKLRVDISGVTIGSCTGIEAWVVASC